MVQWRQIYTLPHPGDEPIHFKRASRSSNFAGWWTRQAFIWNLVGFQTQTPACTGEFYNIGGSKGKLLFFQVEEGLRWPGVPPLYPKMFTLGTVLLALAAVTLASEPSGVSETTCMHVFIPAWCRKVKLSFCHVYNLFSTTLWCLAGCSSICCEPSVKYSLFWTHSCVLMYKICCELCLFPGFVLSHLEQQNGDDLSDEKRSHGRNVLLTQFPLKSSQTGLIQGCHVLLRDSESSNWHNGLNKAVPRISTQWPCFLFQDYNHLQAPYPAPEPHYPGYYYPYYGYYPFHYPYYPGKGSTTFCWGRCLRHLGTLSGQM